MGANIRSANFYRDKRAVIFTLMETSFINGLLYVYNRCVTNIPLSIGNMANKVMPALRNPFTRPTETLYV